jgi:thymidine phosphorylase
MVDIGKAMHRPTVALLTEMNRPLGRAVGHAVEVVETNECLCGRGPADLMEVTMALTAKMVVLGGLESDMATARARLQRVLDSGAALEKWREIIAAQGGDPRMVDEPARLPQARRVVEVRAGRAGFVVDVDAMDIAQAALRLGAGRERVEDRIDHAVGLTDLAQAGERVEHDGLLARLHVNAEHHLDEALALAQRAFILGDVPPAVASLVREEVD